MKPNSHTTKISLFLLLFLLVPCIGLAAQLVSVKKDNVNVRSGPGTNFPVVMELFKGYPLKVNQEKGDWLEIVDFENDKGWIFASLVTPESTVIANGKKSINMRSKPDTKASIVATVDRGVVLSKLSTEGKWVKVRHSQGTTGWIYSPLLWP
ncbi:MAG: SH3 domain-containing protein [Thermodesulfobacteriota bacterium]